MPEPHPNTDEKSFAEKAGLAPALVADLRRRLLKGGVDYSTQKNRVLLSLSGIAKLLQAVGSDPASADELAKKAAACEPATLFVSRHCLNSRLLYATPDRARQESAVTVRVRDSRLHPVGSEIRAHSPAEGERVWRAVPVRKKSRPLS